MSCYHIDRLIYFSSDPNEWNFNKLKIEDIDPYLNKPFNYNSTVGIYNGLNTAMKYFLKNY